MSDEPSTRSPEAVRWERAPAGSFRDPITVEVPYLELTLEHPGLEPTELGESFFPTRFPTFSMASNGCSTGGTRSPRSIRARPIGVASARRRTNWRRSHRGRLTRRRSTARTESVRRGGRRDRRGATRRQRVCALLRTASRYGRRHHRGGCHGRDGGRQLRIPVGDRASISLPERQVTLEEQTNRRRRSRRGCPFGIPASKRSITPIRLPEYRLFPSFDLDLDAGRPVTIPTSHDELEPIALADTLDVDLVSRPYPERVLWQAFAFEVFDPHRDGCPRLAQYPSGLLAVDR